EILGIDTSTVDPGDNEPEFRRGVALNGTEIDSTKHAGTFAIALEPIAAGAMGKAAVEGVCICKIDVQNTTDKFAEVPGDDGGSGSGGSGEVYLQSAAAGSAQILWKQSGTGLKWAVVRLGNRLEKILLVKITGKGDTDGAYKATQIKGVKSDGTPVSLIDPLIFDGAVGNLPQVVEYNHNPVVFVGKIVLIFRAKDDQNKTQLLFAYPKSAMPSILYANITGSTSNGTNKWAYTFAEVKYQTDGNFATKQGAITGTAYN